ncbi:MAG: quinolinate synthase NadA [Atopobiaceae bacterium]|nr:quinolinate synthase NadA [Atopobiaceae bacterium]MCH4120380.1 quinolinate synthase NadA [Atopobiaceae bacterium]MCI1318822.1 quinolinate synthase NadA [Atopobiaceae bacterium]MCI1389410.1 quinolinate synthase NadA [Atopobiaceae bacterium]MCI1432309.1 quinolinate synthase NadA [Atopobiaceae bacterium]
MEEEQSGREAGTLAERVERLKRERGAVVLAHYYVPAETQRLADYVGDSFYLARLAKTLDAPVIVLCGVSFMAESVKLLSPERRVLMPEPAADCPMAHMVRREDVERVREATPDLAVVAYVNTTAEVKRWADVCVTSSNAVKVVRELPERNILFIPDINLGRYVAEQLPEKNVILNRGYCPTHNRIGVAEVEALEEAHPDALVLAHPECTPDVLAETDFIGSTKQIIERVASGSEREFIVLTVVGVAAEIERRTAGQGKRIYFPATTPICPNMAMVTPEKLLACLESMSGEVALPADPERATEPLERMLELAGR